MKTFPKSEILSGKIKSNQNVLVQNSVRGVQKFEAPVAVHVRSHPRPLDAVLLASHLDGADLREEGLLFLVALVVVIVGVAAFQQDAALLPLPAPLVLPSYLFLVGTGTANQAVRP